MWMTPKCHSETRSNSSLTHRFPKFQSIVKVKRLSNLLTFFHFLYPSQWRHLRKSMKFPNSSRRMRTLKRSHMPRCHLNSRTLTQQWTLSRLKRCFQKSRITRSIKFKRSSMAVRANPSLNSIWPPRDPLINRLSFPWTKKLLMCSSRMQTLT